ncbi:hypothetical protein LC087_15025 [Bacillus carboniphilus]|uniref:GH18 domain-containing protein n=1 Tax=Bacillus carboniphilus TaxID=86663 RepID=A0ABY9JRM8_9BACI|nr:hypothetical protein [Bacillus carboniphilus]WLR42067.1 hypothetical protein LC087_15025 [Bacillus carboniphilus]
MSSCCTNFTKFTLPENIQAMLEKVYFIELETLLFKNAQYLMIINNRNNRKYFVQVLNEDMAYFVNLRRLNTTENTGIFITSSSFAIERPERVARKICQLLVQDQKELITDTYPPGLSAEITCTLPVEVGTGKFPWPDNVYAPYVGTTCWPYVDLRDISDNTGVLYFILGFVVADSATDCTPGWATFFDICNVPQILGIEEIRSRGGDVSPSFGGQANTPIWTCASNAVSLAGCYRDIVDLYDFRRLDFDIEGAWVADTEGNERNAEALRILQLELLEEGIEIEIWLTLPVATFGLTADGCALVQTYIDAEVDITGVNAMTMDFVPVEEDMGGASIEALLGLFEQLSDLYPDKTSEEIWQMIGATPLFGENDIPDEDFNLEDAQDILEFAESVNMRLLSGWSINIDVGGFDNEYSEIFNQFTSSDE